MLVRYQVGLPSKLLNPWVWNLGERYELEIDWKGLCLEEVMKSMRIDKIIQRLCRVKKKRGPGTGP